MKIQNQILIISLIFVSTLFNSDELLAKNFDIVKIKVHETHGLSRPLEYIELSIQIDAELFENNNLGLYAEESNSGLKIGCQLSYDKSEMVDNKILTRIVFPVSFKAFEEKEYLIKTKISEDNITTDLKLVGQSTELIIENKFYIANLSKNDSVEGHSNMSGQIRELKIKMGFDQLLMNVEDRLHWAPNFKKPETEYYTTIAQWEQPKINNVQAGQYQISTLRKDLAPDHPEILLTARYRFYAGLPYFRFYSSMQMVDDILLDLLRNDEMAMDSMFTHMAFQRPNGEIIDVEFSERYELLENQPIENDSPWLCFYNQEKGFAFGSIRILYDNTNVFGTESPTYQAHTQIGEWLKGIKYWNRRLIHDQPTMVPKGSTYREDNVYLVFKINDNNKLKDIQYWADRIRSPLQSYVEYPVVNKGE